MIVLKRAMVGPMFSVRFKQHKIFYSVVRPVLVNMVDYFLGAQKTAKMFFHNKAMLRNTLLLSAERVAGRVKVPVPIRSFPSSVFPFRVLFSFLKTPGVWFHYAFSGRSGVPRRLPLCAIVVAFTGTILSLFAGRYDFKNSLAYRAFNPYSVSDSFLAPFYPTHDVLQIKKTAFSGLEKTVMFSRLLTVLKIKNPFPLSTIIVSYFKPTVNLGGDYARY